HLLSPSPPAPDGRSEARALGTLPVPCAILAQELVHVRTLLARRRILERLHKMRPALLDDAQAQVELAESAPRSEGLRIERDGAPELLEGGVHVMAPGVGDPEKRPDPRTLLAGLERPFQHVDCLLDVAALELALGELERLPAVTDELGRSARHVAAGD